MECVHGFDIEDCISCQWAGWCAACGEEISPDSYNPIAPGREAWLHDECDDDRGGL